MPRYCANGGSGDNGEDEEQRGPPSSGQIRRILLLAGKIAAGIEVTPMARKVSRKAPKWLFKEEPAHYSFDDLVRDGETIWDGVRNNLALQNLRQVRKGDRILYYHTGREKALVGEMEATSDPFPDPNSGDDKLVVVKVKPVKSWPKPVPLKRIKETKELLDWDLLRTPRLSVVPISAKQWQAITRLLDEQLAE